jgi:hypothetical protein
LISELSLQLQLLLLKFFFLVHPYYKSLPEFVKHLMGARQFTPTSRVRGNSITGTTKTRVLLYGGPPSHCTVRVRAVNSPILSMSIDNVVIYTGFCEHLWLPSTMPDSRLAPVCLGVSIDALW